MPADRTERDDLLRLAVEANERAERAIQLLMQAKSDNRALTTELARVTKERDEWERTARSIE